MVQADGVANFVHQRGPGIGSARRADGLCFNLDPRVGIQVNAIGVGKKRVARARGLDVVGKPHGSLSRLLKGDVDLALQPTQDVAHSSLLRVGERLPAPGVVPCVGARQGHWKTVGNGDRGGDGRSVVKTEVGAVDQRIDARVTRDRFCDHGGGRCGWFQRLHQRRDRGDDGLRPNCSSGGFGCFEGLRQRETTQSAGAGGCDHSGHCRGVIDGKVETVHGGAP